MKAKRIEEDHARHSSGGARILATLVSLRMMNPTKAIIPIVKSLVEENNLFSFCDGYLNLQCSIT